MPNNEARRLATLRALRLVEMPVSDEMRALVDAIGRLLPAQLVTLVMVEEETVHVMAPQDLALKTAPRASCLAAAIVEAGTLLHVPNLERDPRFRAAAAHKLLGVGHLVGMPIRARNGAPVGALVAGGAGARQFSPETLAAFEHLGRAVEGLLRLQVLENALSGGSGSSTHAVAAGGFPTSWEQLEAEMGAADLVPDLAQPLGRWSRYDPDLLRVVLKKGGLEILNLLRKSGAVRFTDILRAIPDMNQRTLTTRLRELEKHDLIARESYREIPPRVEYRIAPDAQRLVAQLVDLVNAARGES